MSNSIVIAQSCGLGDILFLQKMGRKFIEYGYTVYWPVVDKYNWISQYIYGENLKLGEFPKEDSLTINCQYSIEENHPYDIMTCKYKMIKRDHPGLPDELINMTHDNWQDYLMINRNKAKEDKLYYEVLGLKDNEDYILVNKNFGVDQIKENIGDKIEDKTIKIINMGFINGYTLFDWSKVFENAKDIHTVDTSSYYLIEVLNLKTDKIYIYPRHVDHTEKALGTIAKKNWVWV